LYWSRWHVATTAKQQHIDQHAHMQPAVYTYSSLVATRITYILLRQSNKSTSIR
jgi:hypothetical protein